MSTHEDDAPPSKPEDVRVWVKSTCIELAIFQEAVRVERLRIRIHVGVTREGPNVSGEYGPRRVDRLPQLPEVGNYY